MSTSTLSNKWVNLVINGIIALVIGSIFIFVPQAVYKTIIIILGVLLLLAGLGFVFYANRKGSVPTAQGRVVWNVQGLLNLAIGLFMIFEPQLLYNFIMIFVGIWLIVAGAIQLYDSHQIRNVIAHYRIMMFWGFIDIALGLVIILWKDFPVVVMGYIAYFIAAILFVYAIIFYNYRNKSPYGDVSDADIVEVDEPEDKI